MTNQNNTVQAFWVMLSALTSLMLAIMSSAILSRYLLKLEYGTYKQIIYVYSSLLVIFSAGLPNIFSYFLPKISRERGKDLVDNIMWILIGLGFLFSVFLFLFSGPISRFMGNESMEEGLRWFSIIPIFLLPTLGLDGIFASYQQTHIIPIYNTVSRIFMLSCIILPVIYIENSCIMAIKGWILASLVSFVLALIFKAIPFRGVSKLASGIKISEVFAYSIPLVTASIWGMLIRYSDQFYISRYFGPEVYAEFSNGFIEIPLVSLVTGAVSVVLMPYYSRLAEDKANINEMLSVWKKSLLKSAFIIYPIVTYFIFFGKEIMTFIYSKNYEASGIYFQINMIQSYFNIIMFLPILLAFGKSSFYSNLHLILAMVIWISNYIFLMFFHTPIIVALNSAILTIISVVIGINYVRRIFNINLSELIPFKTIFSLLFYCFFSIFMTIGIFKYLFVFGSVWLTLLITFIFYIISLWSISKLFKLDYFQFIEDFILTFIAKMGLKNIQ